MRSALLSLLACVLLALSVIADSPKVEKERTQPLSYRSYRRPFNYYYPDKFDYYYPRPRYQATRYQRQCYSVNAYGTNIYYCQ